MTQDHYASLEFSTKQEALDFLPEINKIIEVEGLLDLLPIMRDMNVGDRYVKEFSGRYKQKKINLKVDIEFYPDMYTIHNTCNVSAPCTRIIDRYWELYPEA